MIGAAGAVLGPHPAERPDATRFAGLRAWPARVLLAGLLCLIALGLVLAARPDAVTMRTVSPDRSDVLLYKRIAERVAAGDAYYRAATEEQRANGYPLRPFVTVRLPTLAWLQASLGPTGIRLALCGLLGVAWLAFRRRLAATLPPGGVLSGASVLAAAGLLPLLSAALPYVHEAWAGGLILLSLALRTRERWVAAFLVGLFAAAIRELAVPYLCAMAALALVEGRRRESAAWAGAVAAAAAGIAAHAAAVSGYVTALDPASPGWASAGGWSFILSMVLNGTVMILTPAPVIAVAVPLCLLGWAAWPAPLGPRACLVLGGYVAAFTLIGRPDNAYWGLLLGPLLLPGLALAPRALRDLGAAACGAAGPQPALAV